MSEIYKSIDTLAQLNDTEQGLATRLAPLQFGGPEAKPERDEMIATLARLDSINSLIMLISRQQFRELRRLGMADRPDKLFNTIGPGSWNSEIAGLRRRYGNCVDASAITQYRDIAQGSANAD